jgi:hypothetical protein
MLLSVEVYPNLAIGALTMLTRLKGQLVSFIVPIDVSGGAVDLCILNFA